MLFGDLVIAHSLIEELGPRRTDTMLALLEFPDLPLSRSDQEAFTQFLGKLQDQFGDTHDVLSQLRAVIEEQGPCP